MTNRSVVFKLDIGCIINIFSKAWSGTATLAAKTKET